MNSSNSVGGHNGKQDYYIGLDIGTNSVGFALTDTEYNLISKRGNPLWGVRLFDTANTAEERRIFRSARRRLDRRKQRIMLLQDFFKYEIAKKDPAFFQRLNESFFQLEDKEVKQKNTLFNDKNFTDKDFHKKFPTIYHLRKELMESTEKHDIRLYYLAAAHILKKRGHFLYEGETFNASETFKPLFHEFKETANEFLLRSNEDEIDSQKEPEDKFDISNDKINELEKIFTDKLTVTDRTYKLCDAFNIKKNSPHGKLLSLAAGGKVSIKDIIPNFSDDEESNDNITAIKFSSDFDETYDKLGKIFGDDISIIDCTRKLYSFSKLANILGEHQHISTAKVIDSYEKHQNDLKKLKAYAKSISKEIYRQIFLDPIEKNKDGVGNYPEYTGKSKEKHATKEKFYKFLKSILNLEKEVKNNDSEEAKYILNEIEKENFLPLQNAKDNSEIPYQLHLNELEQILSNASKHYPFLNEKDETGLTVKEKIAKILTFRIPYYIGPLNDAHKKEGQRSNSWVVRKEKGKVYPWNFDKLIDKDKTAEEFIVQMTAKCTYLLGADVLPKNSLLYSEYMVLNELNNLKINGEKLNDDIKQKIYTDLFLKETTVTINKVKKYIQSVFGLVDMELSGLDDNFKSSLKPRIELSKISGNKLTYDEMEDIIKTLTLFGDERKLTITRLNARYKNKLSDNEINRIAALRYQGWGRLSKELLTEIKGIDNKTGEETSILERMHTSSDNFMEILSNEKYTFSREIDKYNKERTSGEEEFTYENLVEPLYCSPSVKRGIWQSLLITDELVNAMGAKPKKIFIEVAREEGEKKRTLSRKMQLEKLYKSIKFDEVITKPYLNDIQSSLQTKTDADLRRKKLYLYYLQMGKCMYSGNPIDLSSLDTNKYDIDHIYPQSKVKDDSFENTVLVERRLNQDIKRDIYPLPEGCRPPAAQTLWKALIKIGLLSKAKYEKLVRNTGFNDTELAGFINRQLVETRQSSKAVAQILKNKYKETNLVYSKAGNISDFRQKFNILKVRELNDLHHAEDAYLNIIVGNVFDTKFTQNPIKFIQDAKQHYHMDKIYEKDIERNGKYAWVTKIKDGNNGKTPTIDIIKNNIDKKCYFTRLSTVSRGQFYKMNLLKKGKGQAPIKGSEERLTIEKYGGYNSEETAYFFLVEHTVKNNKVRSIERVTTRFVKQIEDKKLTLEEYCAEQLELKDLRILLAKIKHKTLFKINGFPMHITGVSGYQLVFSGAVQFKLGKTEIKEVNSRSKAVDFQFERTINDYVKKVTKYIERNKQYKNETLPIRDMDGITKEENIKLFNLFLDKLENSIYSKRLSNKLINKIKNGKELFIELTSEQQCETLYNLLNLFGCGAKTSVDITNIGESKNFGIIQPMQILNEKDNPKIIYQSPAGLKSREIDLFSL